MLVYKYIHINQAYFQRGAPPSPDRLRSPNWLIIILDQPLHVLPQMGKVRFAHKGIFEELPFHLAAPAHGTARVVEKDGEPVLAVCSFSYLGCEGMERQLIFSQLHSFIGKPLVGHHYGAAWCFIERFPSMETDLAFYHWLEYMVARNINPCRLRDGAWLGEQECVAFRNTISQL